MRTGPLFVTLVLAIALVCGPLHEWRRSQWLNPGFVCGNASFDQDTYPPGMTQLREFAAALRTILEYLSPADARQRLEPMLDRTNPKARAVGPVFNATPGEILDATAFEAGYAERTSKWEELSGESLE